MIIPPIILVFSEYGYIFPYEEGFTCLEIVAVTVGLTNVTQNLNVLQSSIGVLISYTMS